ncbi:MAG: hypothetical protein AB7O95_20960 [Geminicoccaceae bacterium]
MIVCSEHWEKLKQLVCECGMGHLLHQPHDEFEEFAAEICGHRPRHTAFDPLIACRKTAEALAVSHGGSYLCQHTASAESRCPICALVAALPTENIEPNLYWTATVVGRVESQARAKGLMPRAA